MSTFHLCRWTAPKLASRNIGSRKACARCGRIVSGILRYGRPINGTSLEQLEHQFVSQCDVDLKKKVKQLRSISNDLLDLGDQSVSQTMADFIHERFTFRSVFSECRTQFGDTAERQVFVVETYKYESFKDITPLMTSQETIEGFAPDVDKLAERCMRTPKAALTEKQEAYSTAKIQSRDHNATTRVSGEAFQSQELGMPKAHVSCWCTYICLDPVLLDCHLLAGSSTFPSLK